jgi:K+-transporting ATPase c subunit
MGGNDGSVPRAYSTQLGYDYQKSDGYNVVIDPDKLQGSIEHYKQGLAGKSPQDLNNTIVEALIDSSAFGMLPNATSAYNEVRKFVSAHTSAMHDMGISLDDFVARVQAAANLGYEADPVTKQRAAFARAHERME